MIEQDFFYTSLVVPEEHLALAKLLAESLGHETRLLDGRTIDLRIYSYPQADLARNMANRDFPIVLVPSSLERERFAELWRERFPQEEPLLVNSYPVASTPVVMAMAEQTAEQLQRRTNRAPLGWQSLLSAINLDYPLRIMRAHGNSADGELISIAQHTALANHNISDAIRQLEASVMEYGPSDRDVLSQALGQGRWNTDVVIAQENHVLQAIGSHGISNAAIVYPHEGTIWSDHQLALLRFWDLERQYEVYKQLVQLTQQPQTISRLHQGGFHASLDDYSGSKQEVSQFYRHQQVAKAKVYNYSAPPMVLPGINVVRQIGQVWAQAKRSADVCLLVDISGSMSAQDKLPSAINAIGAFLDKFQDPGSRAHVIAFNDKLQSVTPSFEPIVNSRGHIKSHLHRITTRDSTALLDAIVEALRILAYDSDSSRIHAIVAMTDGQENASRTTESGLISELAKRNDILLFGVAYGADADKRLLHRLTSVGRGKVFHGTQTGIQELYEQIALHL